MRQLKKLDIRKSISHKRLIYEEGFFDTSDSVFFYFTNIVIVIGSILIWKIKFNPNDEFIIYITPFSLFYAFYNIYRKATEKNLTQLETPFDKETNKNILFEFGTIRRYDIYRDTKDCLILNESNDYFNTTYCKSMIFLIDDRRVYFTMLQDGKTNNPILTSHLFLQKDLKKLFKEHAATKPAGNSRFA